MLRLASTPNAIVYSPVASYTTPANTGAASSSMFIGTCDSPIIIPKDFLPKYSPRMDTVSGLRPPNPAPNSNANPYATGRVAGPKVSRNTPDAWIQVNTKQRESFGHPVPEVAADDLEQHRDGRVARDDERRGLQAVPTVVIIGARCAIIAISTMDVHPCPTLISQNAGVFTACCQVKSICSEARLDTVSSDFRRKTHCPLPQACLRPAAVRSLPVCCE